MPLREIFSQINVSVFFSEIVMVMIDWLQDFASVQSYS